MPSQAPARHTGVFPSKRRDSIEAWRREEDFALREPAAGGGGATLPTLAQLRAQDTPALG